MKIWGGSVHTPSFMPGGATVIEFKKKKAWTK
jgi:hypothetical protein